MNKSLNDHVNTAMMLLKRGLQPFVEKKLKESFGDTWRQEAASGVRSRDTADRIKRGQLDAAALLEIIWNHWQDVFRNSLTQTERTLVSELWDNRKELAHQEEFDWDSTYRILDSIERLLRTISATEADEVKIQKEQLRRVMVEEESRRKQHWVGPAATAITKSGEPRRDTPREAHTLSKGIKFTYYGDVQTGVRVKMGEEQDATEATFTKDLFHAIRTEFCGKTVIGGFSMTNPPPQGLGYWIQHNSGKYGYKLTPRHGSFIAAILVAEGYCTARINRGVSLEFPIVDKPA